MCVTLEIFEYMLHVVNGEADEKLFYIAEENMALDVYFMFCCM